MTILLAVLMAVALLAAVVGVIVLMMWLATSGHEWIVCIIIVIGLVTMTAYALYPLASSILGNRG